MKDVAIGLGVVGAFAVCCGAPIIISMLASGAVLGAVGLVWLNGRVVLLSGAAVLLVTGLWLRARRRTSHVGGGPDCCAPLKSVDGGAQAEQASGERAANAKAIFGTTRPRSTLR